MGKVKLDDLQKPITKLVFDHAGDKDTNPEYYIVGWPCDIDVSKVTQKIMEEDFNNIYGGELLIVRMEFLGINFLDKNKLAK